MGRLPGLGLRLRLASGFAVLLGLALGIGVASEIAPRMPGPMTTRERLRQTEWWPTRATADQKGFAGSESCNGCHTEIAKTQPTSQMARTLLPAGRSAIGKAHAGTIYTSGTYSYALEHSGEDLLMHVSDGVQTRSATMDWAFGSGEVGQSYLWQKDGAYQESRFNYFSSLHGFGATPGRLRGAPTSLDMATGRKVADFEARTCFACHTTALTSAEPLSTAKFVPGIQCESCHGPGARHAAAMNGDERGNDLHILNSAHLSPVDAVDFCGACHGSPKDVELMGVVGEPTVRFPAYRLEQSRCWGKAGDARVTCTGCHDPHQPLARQAAAYDGACLRCHVPDAHTRVSAERPGAACPVAKSNCTSCHMPKIEVADMHSRFTDHRIRVVKANAPFPD